jgi:hypothetical protein
MKHKTRLIVLVAVVIGVTLLGSCTTEQPTIPTTNAPVPESANEEYNVYSALLNSRFTDNRIKLIVIEEQTQASKTSVEDYAKNIPDLQQETIDDFYKANQQSHKLERQFNLPFNYTLISQAELKNIFDSGGWDNFYKKYPNSPGITSLSGVGFNAQKNQALVSIGTQSHYLAGAGYIVLLAKENGIWRVKQQVMTWIS